MDGKRSISGFFLLMAVFIIVVVLAGIKRPAYAAGVVNTCDESNLKAAINGGGTVTFTCSGTIVLTDMIYIYSDTTIDGTGQNVSISGDNTVRLFQVDIFNSIPATLTLKNLTLTNGYGDSLDEAVPHDGGAILNYGTLNITGCTFSNNSVPLGNEGGAIYSSRPFAVNVSISNSTFSGNSASVGGAIKIAYGTLNVSESTFSGNTVTGYGAALDLPQGNGTIGNVTINKTSFLNNIGQQEGAINHDSGTLTITNSTFAGNKAQDGIGGAIFSSSAVFLANSTFYANSSTEGGGAIYFESYTGSTAMMITNCTFADNNDSWWGGAIYFGSGTLTLRNTIVADRAVSPSVENCWGAITDGGNNLQFGGSDTDSCGAAIPISMSDPLGSNVLADNGGPTQTIALPADSEAIDAGNDTFCAAAPLNGLDQRGITRPQGPQCDIGAYEYSIPCASPPSDMIAWWSGDGHPFDLIDGNNGTLDGNTTYADGKVGKAFSFDGSRGAVFIPNVINNSPNVINNPNGTIDMWVKFNSLKNENSLFNAVYLAEPNSISTIFVGDSSYCGGNVFCFVILISPDTYIVDSDIAPVAGQWYHVAVTWGSGGMKIYVDGVLKDTNTDYTGPILSGSSHFMGTSAWSTNGIDGLIDEVEIFNRALTDEEIAAIYAADYAGKCKPCFSPPMDLVSWWPFDEGTGTIANDFIGLNTGSVNGATWTIGKVEGALSFDGVDDYVSVPDSSSLDFSQTSPMTIDLWAYRTASDPIMHFIAKRNNCGSINYQIAFDKNSGLHFVGDNGGVVTYTDLPLNTWTHLAGTFDGVNTFKFYINGLLAAAGSGTLGPVNDFPLTIGKAGSCPYLFNGLIDEVELFNRALSAEEIAAIYAAGNIGKCKPDVDLDGVPDATDNCPNTSNPGQEDADSDTFGDACEECDNDPSKTVPGVCGCGVADIDTDQDGTPDCNDQCYNDPNKAVPGICGCGVAETDTDIDGILDCNDNCDSALNADQADSDQDGVGDACDNCLSVPNPTQGDTDRNGVGDICEYMSDLTGRWTNFHYEGSDEIFGNLQVSNIGDRAARSFVVSFYLSDDGTNLSRFLRKKLIRSLNANRSLNISFSVSIYRTSLSGKYIIAFIDSDNQIKERDENNNWVVQLIP